MQLNFSGGQLFGYNNKPAYYRVFESKLERASEPRELNERVGLDGSWWKYFATSWRLVSSLIVGWPTGERNCRESLALQQWSDMSYWGEQTAPACTGGVASLGPALEVPSNILAGCWLLATGCRTTMTTSSSSSSKRSIRASGQIY